MKTFALYCPLEIDHASEIFWRIWKRYRGERPPYVTIKQTCFAKEKDVDIIQEKLDDYFYRGGIRTVSIPVVFNIVKTAPDWPIIMLLAEPCEPLLRLHKDLVETLHSFQEFAEPELKNHEENYEPHLTIATDLSPEESKLLATELLNGCMVEGNITKVVLELGAGKEIHTYGLDAKSSQPEAHLCQRHTRRLGRRISHPPQNDKRHSTYVAFSRDSNNEVF